jgi:hypothetical protein
MVTFDDGSVQYTNNSYFDGNQRALLFYIPHKLTIIQFTHIITPSHSDGPFFYDLPVVTFNFTTPWISALVPHFFPNPHVYKLLLISL